MKKHIVTLNEALSIFPHEFHSHDQLVCGPHCMRGRRCCEGQLFAGGRLGAGSVHLGDGRRLCGARGVQITHSDAQSKYMMTAIGTKL